MGLEGSKERGKTKYIFNCLCVLTQNYPHVLTDVIKKWAKIPPQQTGECKTVFAFIYNKQKKLILHIFSVQNLCFLTLCKCDYYLPMGAGPQTDKWREVGTMFYKV